MDKIEEVLAELREEEKMLSTELAGVKHAIAVIERALAGGAKPALAPDPRPYVDMELYEAVALILAEAGEPKNSSEIADALRAGGFPSRAEKLNSTVLTMLKRTDRASAWGIRRIKSGNRMRWYVRED